MKIHIIDQWQASLKPNILSPGAQAVLYRVTDTKGTYSIVDTSHVHSRVTLPPYIITFTPHGEKTALPDLLKSTHKSAIVISR
jgi:hypothetical protein